jgi:4-hydroxybenzoate polyprenyltransferase
LQLGLANQTLPRAIAEDTLNHPGRPIPAGRISVGAARALRLAMIPLCLLLSAAYGPWTMLASLGSSLFIWGYNECGGANGHWFIRNALNAVGYSVAEVGATLVACMCLFWTCRFNPQGFITPQQTTTRVKLVGLCVFPLR